MSETSINPEQKSTATTWHILGVGSIGGLLAAHISATDHHCRLLLKAHQREIWQKQAGITIQFGSSSFKQTHNIDCDDIGNRTIIERLIVTTKAQDTLTALDSVQHRLSEKTVLYLVQNGMGIAELIQQKYPQITLIKCTTAEGAYRPKHQENPFYIVHAGRNKTLTGFSADTAQYAADFASACGPILNVKTVENIDAYLWKKLAVNTVINPLTALNNCNNGDLAKLPLRMAVNQLCDELELFAAHFSQGKWLNDIRKNVFDVINDTAQNCSSMRADVLAKRKTEIEYITGFLCAEAEKLGISLPRHAALLELIRLKEASY